MEDDRKRGPHRFLEPSPTDTLLLLAFHRVVHQDSRAEDVDFSLGEDVDSREECAVGVLERVGQEEPKDEATGNGKKAHDHKEPLEGY